MMKFTYSLLILCTILLSSNTVAAPKMKTHHKEAGLTCTSCHLTKPFDFVETQQCLTCHELPEQKTDYHGAPDEHDSPHYGVTLECENCHIEHGESVDFCADCHDFNFKTP